MGKIFSLSSFGTVALLLASLFQAEARAAEGQQHLLVVNQGNSSIERYDGTTGAFVDVFVPPASGGLNGPRRIVFGPDRNLYVASYNTHTVLKYDGSTGAFLGAFVPVRGGGLANPVGMAFGADGNLYVVSSATSQVLRYNGSTGAPLGVFTSATLDSPRDMSFGPDGNLYVLCQGSSRVLRFNGSTGQYMNVFVAPGSGGLATVGSMSFGPDGNLYISNVVANNILKFSGSTGAFLGISSSGNGLSYPYGITFGPDQQLYVSNYSGHSVFRFDGLTGAFISTFVAAGSGGLSQPAFLTFSPKPLNHAPLANAGVSQQAEEGALVTLDGSASSDSDGDSLSFEWSQVAGPAVALSLADPAHPTFTAPAVPSGGLTLTFSLVVSDGLATSSPALVNISVKNVNQAPVADAGALQTVSEGSLVTLNAGGSYDPDADALTYSWVQTGGTAVSLLNASAMQPSFTAPSVLAMGELLTFQVTVSDGSLSSTASVSVLVQNVNHIPLANAGLGATVEEQQSVILDGSKSSDPDGDSLSYSWTQTAGPAVTLDLKDPVHPTFVAPATSSQLTLTFELVVSDGQASSAPASVSIIVAPISHPPICSAARASTTMIWPPSHAMVPISIAGVTDASANPAELTITRVTQDEPTNGLGDGDTDKDAALQEGSLLIRAERQGSGNGRVYQIEFTARNSSGASCSGAVKVCVPKNAQAKSCTDDGQRFLSSGN